MTQIDGPARRRLINWSLRPQVNRVMFALIVGWLFWLAVQRPGELLVLVIAAPVYALVTIYFRWRDYPGTDRKL